MQPKPAVESTGTYVIDGTLDCPARVTPGSLERSIGVRHCELRDACLHLGLHQHGTQCPHLVYLDREDKLRD